MLFVKVNSIRKYQNRSQKILKYKYPKQIIIKNFNKKNKKTITEILLNEKQINSKFYIFNYYQF